MEDQQDMKSKAWTPIGWAKKRLVDSRKSYVPYNYIIPMEIGGDWKVIFDRVIKALDEKNMGTDIVDRVTVECGVIEVNGYLPKGENKNE